MLKLHRTKRFAGAAALGFGLLMSVAMPGMANDALQKIRVTIPVLGMNFLPLFAAVDKGHFAKEGIEAEIIITSGDGPDVDALIAGSVDFTVSTANRLLMSYEQGKPLLAIMNLANRNAVDCVMRKDVAERLGITEDTPLEDKLKALEGLRVAGTRPGAFTYLVLVDYAQRTGLVPQEDLQILGAGGGPSMIPAIENGLIDVACNTSPATDTMVERGSSIMFTHNSVGMDEEYNDFLFELLYVRPEFAKENPELVRSVVRGLLAAIADLHDTPVEEQLPFLRERFSGVEDQMLVDILTNLKDIFPRDGRVTEISLEKVTNFLVGTGAVQSGAPYEVIASTEYLPQ